MRPFTGSCFLLLVLGRLFLFVLPVLLGIFLRSLWTPPFPLHALASISPSLAKVRLSPTLTLSPFMIWCFGQTALFFFLLLRAAPAYLPTALFVALRSPFPLRQAQFVPVFPLKPAPFCTLFAGLGNTIKSAIFLLFSCLTLVLSSPPCPLLHIFSYLKLCGISGRNCLLCPPVLSGYNGQRRSSRPPNPPIGGGPRPTLGAQVSLKLLFGYVTIFSSADLFTTDLNCRKKLACDIISECNVILSRRI